MTNKKILPKNFFTKIYKTTTSKEALNDVIPIKWEGKQTSNKKNCKKK